MTPEWVGAAASIGTFVVIAASAVAAVNQLRHMRSGNQISLFTAYNTEFDSEQFSSAFAFIRTELPSYAYSADELHALANGRFPGRLHDARMIANFFEDMGAFVRTGMLHRTIVCNLYAENVTDAWEAISPLIFFLREQREQPAIWENFEYLGILADDFKRQHPSGIYPSGVRRKPHDDSLNLLYKATRGGEPLVR